MKSLLNKSMAGLLLVLACCGNAMMATAQGFSYVYIQGDKKTPVYVKVEGEMLPRYGKHYALISRLAPGPLNVDILFQQNEYPPLHFTILVPENGKRAFMVNKKDGAFYLYDLEQNFYLKPNNELSDDHLPTVISSGSLALAEPPVKENITAAKTIKEPAKAELQPASEPEPAQPEPAVPTPANPKPQDASPQFIEHITFNNDNSATTAPNSNNTAATAAAADPVPNSDCQSVIQESSFRRLLGIINARQTEDEKLGTFLEYVAQYCFTTDMTAEIVSKLTTDAARFSALKKVYPKTTDQSRFASLESLLSDAEWKEYFRDMVNH